MRSIFLQVLILALFHAQSSFAQGTFVDLNGDGYPDLLYQNDMNGSVAYRLMKGLQPLNNKLYHLSSWRKPVGWPTSWRLAGAADLNGDGYPDLLFQNDADGSVAYRLMKGLEPLGTSYITYLPGEGPSAGLSNWRLVGAADLNGDGYPDLLFQNDADGSVAYRLMKGLEPLGTSYITYLPGEGPSAGLSNWRLAGAADLNGDGHPDLLFQNIGNGSVAYRLMKGLEPLGTSYITYLPGEGPSAGLTNWRLAGAADLNGDGHPDLLFQNIGNGSVAYRLIKGLQPLTTNYITYLPGEGPSAGLTNWPLMGSISPPPPVYSAWSSWGGCVNGQTQSTRACQIAGQSADCSACGGQCLAAELRLGRASELYGDGQ